MAGLRKKPTFIPMTSGRGPKAIFSVNSVACVKITGSGQVNMTKEIYQSLGSPTYMSMAFSPDSGLVKLDGIEMGKENRKSFARKVTFMPYINNFTGSTEPDGYYYIRLNKTRFAEEQGLQIGYYVPIGGGVFKFHGANIPTR